MKLAAKQIVLGMALGAWSGVTAIAILGYVFFRPLLDENPEAWGLRVGCAIMFAVAAVGVTGVPAAIVTIYRSTRV